MMQLSTMHKKAQFNTRIIRISVLFPFSAQHLIFLLFYFCGAHNQINNLQIRREQIRHVEYILMYHRVLTRGDRDGGG